MVLPRTIVYTWTQLISSTYTGVNTRQDRLHAILACSGTMILQPMSLCFENKILRPRPLCFDVMIRVSAIGGHGPGRLSHRWPWHRPSHPWTRRSRPSVAMAQAVSAINGHGTDRLTHGPGRLSHQWPWHRPSHPWPRPSQPSMAMAQTVSAMTQTVSAVGGHDPGGLGRRL